MQPFDHGRSAGSVVVAGVVGACLLATGPALAAGPQGMRNNDSTPAETYWTPERLRSAQPTPLPQGGPAPKGGDAAPPIDGRTVDKPGRPPAAGIKPGAAKELFRVEGSARPQSGVEVQAKGTSGMPFSTRRVEPQAGVETFPYRTAGKLFYQKQDGSNWVCSASSFNRRLVATAGHCVFDTVANQWHKNFLFVPAYRKVGTTVTSRYGQWNWNWVFTTASWINGTGSVPNKSDTAVIVARDQTFSSAVRPIGDVTGTLGWRTLSLGGNHVHELGYPGNLDSGLMMEETTAQTGTSVFTNTVQWGSDMRGGSSGGPVIQDFGIHGGGDPTTTASGNRIVGLVSYGPTDTAPRYQGASILDQEWIDMVNAGCANAAGNCY